MSDRPSYLVLLRERPFRFLWLAQLVSQSGDAVFDVALLWLVLAATGSAALVGLTQAAVLLPSALVGPAAGVYADRLNRKDLMIASNLFQGAVTGILSLLYLTGALNFPVLILFVLLLYTGAQFFRAANGAIIPRIVSRENLGAANGLFTLTTSANQLASYALGGAVLAAVGAGVSITYDSVTFFVAAAIMTLMARSYGQTGAVGDAGSVAGGGFRRDFREGLEYVKQSKLFLELVVFGVIVNFIGAILITGLAPYVKLWLGGGALDYGFVLSSLSLGVIIGSVVLGKTNFRAFVGKLLFAGVLLAGLVTVVAGLATTVPEGLVLFFAIGILEGVINLPIQVLVQSQVPGELLGRASTVLGALLVASQPAGAVVFGAVASGLSLGEIFVGSGLILAFVTATLYAPFSALRNAKY